MLGEGIGNAQVGEDEEAVKRCEEKVNRDEEEEEEGETEVVGYVRGGP